MRREWSDSRQRLEDIVDHPVTVGSVPGGYFSRTVAEAAAAAGLRTLYTSEPTTRSSIVNGLRIVGRFTLRRGHPPDMALRFASAAPWARCGHGLDGTQRRSSSPCSAPRTRVLRTGSWSQIGETLRHRCHNVRCGACGRSAERAAGAARIGRDSRTEGYRQTIRVPAGGDLQKALDEAKPGDRIELQARATYQGPFRLKAKEGEAWIVITSSAELPKPGRHVQPSDASAMPKLTSAGDLSSQPIPVHITTASSGSSSRRKPARS
jgi:hypothetical protein